MPNCNQCSGSRIAIVSAKVSDRCSFQLSDPKLGEVEHFGYVPTGVGIDDGDGEDYLDFNYCLNCGQIQGEFPIKENSVVDFVKKCKTSE